MNKKLAPKYYVYTLAYPDGTVFYVGKGQGNRIEQHEPEARRDIYCPTLKSRVIQSIWADGGEVVKSKVYETDAEADALLYEWILINMVYCRNSLINERYGAGTISHAYSPTKIKTYYVLEPFQKIINQGNT